MQPYIITSFKRINDQAIFRRVENGTNSGGYVNGTEVKRLRDFICDGNFVIHSVLRTQGNVTFTLLDVLTTPRAPITSIKIVNSEVVLYCSDTQSIRLVNAAKFVEPVATPVTTTTTRRVGRPTNAEIAARNNTTTTTTTPRATAFNEVEATITRNNPRAIRIQGLLRRRRESLQEFLVRFFQEWNLEKNTIYVDDNAVQTAPNKRRSLGDIYMICKYYYPNCTLNEVLNLLYNVVPTVITRGYRTSYCFTINKRVWYYSENSANTVADQAHTDEFGKQYQFYLNNITR